MSKRCPHCGSYNTEILIGNFAGRAAIDTIRVVAAGGAGVLGFLGGGLLNHGMGHKLGEGAAKEVWKKTDPGEFKGYKCCNCKKEFSA